MKLSSEPGIRFVAKNFVEGTFEAMEPAVRFELTTSGLRSLVAVLTVSATN